jgi:hypothetical protein
MTQTWEEQARKQLLELRGRASAWGYRRNGAPSAEPTALACLGLLASGDALSAQEDLATARRSAGWLAMVQRPDGSVPVSRTIDTPGWATPYAILLWHALSGFEQSRRRGRGWLIQIEGLTLPRAAQPGSVIGHDSSSIGWPWVAGTHSWIEPTAMAIVALCREGMVLHPRVEHGFELILDRSLAAGGWNYGNKAVFGHELRPQPGPTGLALLALAARSAESRQARAAIDYLRTVLPGLRAGVSLGWGVLGLRAFGACPIEAERWLAEAYEQCAPNADAALGVALLLLAASERSLTYLLDPVGRSAPAAQRTRPSEPSPARIE